jgi:hypothetical protein
MKIVSVICFLLVLGMIYDYAGPRFSGAAWIAYDLTYIGSFLYLVWLVYQGVARKIAARKSS